MRDLISRDLGGGSFAVGKSIIKSTSYCRACRSEHLPPTAYLAKLLNAADCGFIQSGTRDVFSCSAINLCISSETEKKYW